MRDHAPLICVTLRQYTHGPFNCTSLRLRWCFDMNESCITHMNEPCCRYGWVMWHIWMRYVTHTKELCHTYECVVSHIWMQHVSHTWMGHDSITFVTGYQRVVNIAFCADVLQCITAWYRCVAVRCSVLQCVAVCCSALSCVAVRYRVLQCVVVCCRCVPLCCSMLQHVACVAVCCSVMQCVIVCCGVMQCVAVCCNVLQCITHSIKCSTGYQRVVDIECIADVLQMCCSVL